MKDNKDNKKKDPFFKDLLQEIRLSIRLEIIFNIIINILLFIPRMMLRIFKNLN